MSFTLTTSANVTDRAGINASTTILADSTWLNSLSDEAEAFIYANTRYDWVSNFSNIKTNAKPFFSELASCLIAIEVIRGDMSGFTSRTEAQTMLSVLDDKVRRMIDLIKDVELQKVFKIA